MYAQGVIRRNASANVLAQQQSSPVSQASRARPRTHVGALPLAKRCAVNAIFLLFAAQGACGSMSLSRCRDKLAHSMHTFHIGEHFGSQAAHIHRTDLPDGDAGPQCATDVELIFEPAGGWGDQLRGMVMAHHAALLTAKRFRVHWPHGFNLTDYFNAQLRMVTLPREVRSQMPVIEAVDRFDFFKDASNIERIRDMSDPFVLHTNAYQWLHLVRSPVVRLAAEYYGLAGLSFHDLFVLSMQVLLPSVTAPVQHAVNRVLHRDLDTAISLGKRASKRPFHSTIGVQIRTGGLGENWIDSETKHSIEDVRCFAEEARRLCRPYCAIFLTADSAAAALMFKSFFADSSTPVFEFTGEVLHTDRPVPDSVRSIADGGNDPWLKTFVDWTAMTQVDVLLMSRSGFGWTAAWAGSVPYVRWLALGNAEAACSWNVFDKSADFDGNSGWY